MLHRVTLVRSDISEECIASIIREKTISSLILVTLMMMILSSETSVLNMSYTTTHHRRRHSWNGDESVNGNQPRDWLTALNWIDSKMSLTDLKGVVRLTVGNNERATCRNYLILGITSSRMLRHVALVRTYFSEELGASFIRVTRIGELGTTLAVTSNRRTLQRNTKSYLPYISLIPKGFMKQEESHVYSGDWCTYLHLRGIPCIFWRLVYLSPSAWNPMHILAIGVLISICLESHAYSGDWCTYLHLRGALFSSSLYCACNAHYMFSA
jgi:hypothetical protein